MTDWRNTVLTAGRRLFAALVLVALAAAPALAQADVSPNLLRNPGFEDAVTINTVEATGNWLELLKRAVDIEQSESLAMPAGWGPNSGDGWLVGQAAKLRYVTGKPGAEVYAGTRALYVASKGHASVSATGIKVRTEKSAGETTLLSGRPNRFSIYAKGNGRLMVYAYTYDQRTGTNIYGVTKMVPDGFVLTPAWTKYEGTIEFTSAEVGLGVFVIAIVGGQATIDDAAFYAE